MCYTLPVFFFPREKKKPSRENFWISARENVTLPVKKSWKLPVKNQKSPWNFPPNPTRENEKCGREKNENFHPWKPQKCPWKKNLAKFHEIYSENILIMNFVTITLSKRNHRWFFMEIRTFDLKRYRCFEFSIIHHKFTASSYRLLQLWLQNHLEKKQFFHSLHELRRGNTKIRSVCCCP